MRRSSRRERRRSTSGSRTSTVSCTTRGLGSVFVAALLGAHAAMAQTAAAQSNRDMGRQVGWATFTGGGLACRVGGGDSNTALAKPSSGRETWILPPPTSFAMIEVFLLLQLA